MLGRGHIWGPFGAWYLAPLWCDYDPDLRPEGDPLFCDVGHDVDGVIERWTGVDGAGLGFGTAIRLRAVREVEGDVLVGTQYALESTPAGWTKYPTLAAAQAHYTASTGKAPDGVIK